MNTNAINYQQISNELFDWWEEDQKCKLSFTPWLDDVNKVADFAEWVGTEPAIDIITNKMCEYFKDVDDAECIANELIKFIVNGANKFIKESM